MPESSLFAYAPSPDGFDPSPYPPSEQSNSPRPVWAVGACDEVTGVMAAGHDTVSASVLREYRTQLIGGFPDDLWWETADIEPAWVLIHTECGCTEAQHIEHEQAAEGEDGDAPSCDSMCQHPGLPPCTEPGTDYSYAWTAEDATADTAGALPVTRTVREPVRRG